MNLASLARTAGALLGSRTIWGAVILLANSTLSAQLPLELGNEMAGAMTNLFAAIGTGLVIIGRLGAKPILVN